MRLRRTLPVAGLGAAVVLGSLAPVTSSAAPAAPIVRAADEPAGQVVLDDGHIDLFELTYDATDAEFVLQVKDDTRIHDPETVFRDPEDVVIQLDQDVSRLVVPEELPQAWYDLLGPAGTVLHVTDEVQVPGLPWPGWSSERMPEQLAAAGIELTTSDYPAYQNSQVIDLHLDITGPGDVFTWMNDFEPIHPFIDTRTGKDTIPMPLGSHVHTSWGFSEPGTYTIEATPHADVVGGGEITGDTRTYTVNIGGRDVRPLDAPSITGSGRVGEVVTVDPGQWEPSDADLSYAWFVGDQQLNADGRQLRVPARVPGGAPATGEQLRVQVTARSPLRPTSRLRTAPRTVTAGVAPRAVVRPKLSGPARVGSRLTLDPGRWSLPSTQAYTWRVGPRRLPGTDRRSYVLRPADRGHRVWVTVTARSDGHLAGRATTPTRGPVAVRRR